MRKLTDEEVIVELKRVHGANNNKAPALMEWATLSTISADVLYRAFGSYAESWRAAGFEYGTDTLKRADIIDALKTVFVQDRSLGVSELIRKAGYTLPTIMKYFGSTHAALQVAKIDLNKRIPDEAFVEEYVRIYDLLGRIPTAKDLNGNSKYAANTYRRRFGDLETVAKRAGLELDTKLKETEEELLVELNRVCDELGHTPTSTELSTASKFGQMAYRRAFGSFSAALGKIGHTINAKRKVSHACPVCGMISKSTINHVKLVHPDEYSRQEEHAITLFKSGLSQREIASRNDTIFKGGSSVARVIHKHLTVGRIEQCRRDKIRAKLTEYYAAGKYDWVNHLNSKRNATPEARAKNSIGLKKAYEDGSRVSWNDGQTKYINPIIAASAIKISERMKYQFTSGEVDRQLGPDSSNWNEKRDEVAGRYRLGLNFTSEQRGLIKKRAEYKCEKCNITQEILEETGQTLECDHILPIYCGGLNDWVVNGQALCPVCHKSKTSEDSKKGPDDQ
jgi:hypothetical protein